MKRNLKTKMKKLVTILLICFAITAVAQSTQVINSTDSLANTENNKIIATTDTLEKVENTATNPLLPLSIMRQSPQTSHDNKWQIGPNNYQGFKYNKNDKVVPLGSIIQGAIAH